MKLTFYLFQESVKDFEEAISKNKLSGDYCFKQVRLKPSVAFEGVAYFQCNRPTAPKWLDFVAEHCELPDGITVENQTNSFLLLIRARDRIFGITAGFGFAAINRERLETAFGLKTTLNSIDPEKIKCLDVYNLDVVARQRRTLANQDSPLAGFDLNPEEDLIRMVAGRPANPNVARRMFGSDSLSLTAEVEFPRLREKCEELLDLYQREDYKKHFDFIDHIRLVKDEALKRTLDAALVQALENRVTEKLTLAYPDLEWQKVESFTVKRGRKERSLEDVDVKEVYAFMEEENVSVDLRKIKIVPLGYESQAVGTAAPLYEYVNFETVNGGLTYVLCRGRWYQVDNDYLQELETYLRKIPEIDVRDYLPPYTGGREDAYNKHVASTDKNYVCLDKQNFHIRGQAIEICDLLRRDGHLVCVKRAGKSCNYSHLFSQGSVSATLFNDDPAYRQAVAKHIPRDWPQPFDADKPDHSKITVVYAVPMTRNAPFVENLPVFSKINLRHHARHIRRMGFGVGLYRIPYRGRTC